MLLGLEEKIAKTEGRQAAMATAFTSNIRPVRSLPGAVLPPR
jgi:hypothetical protein